MHRTQKLIAPRDPERNVASDHVLWARDAFGVALAGGDAEGVSEIRGGCGRTSDMAGAYAPT
jgi:hypothetical protein